MTTNGAIDLESFSQQQREAYNGVSAWLADSEGDPVYRLFGFAGTGKTTIANALVQNWRPEGRRAVVRFAAFTGKAALVMRSKGMTASTIHSLIYAFIPPDKDYCTSLEERIKAADEANQTEQAVELRKELREAKVPRYEINEASILHNADLAVLDECSMINDDLMTDVLSFNKPILVLGDPGQLPPIQGSSKLVNGPPHSLLTQIHRQAEGSPIIQLATIARQQSPPKWPRGELADGCRVIRQAEMTDDMVLNTNQIIVGKNATRRGINQQMRKMLKLEGVYPIPGDRVICLRNNKKLGIFNGQQFIVEAIGKEYDRYIYFTIRDMVSNLTMEIPFLRAHFDDYYEPGALKKLQWWDFQDANEFDFGYAITCHKAQGSQWDSVLIYDDGFYLWDPAMRRKWLYTAITRAAKQLILVTR